MNGSIKKICIMSMGIALFAVLSLCVQVPVFENYYLCLGYVVITVFCCYFGSVNGMTVGFLGVIVYCLLTNGLRGMPGWSLGNLVVGFIVGLAFKLTLKIKNQRLRYAIVVISIVVSVAVGMLGVKSLVESLLYSQPIFFRMIKNFYAFVSDSGVMIAAIPICVSLKKTLARLSVYRTDN